MPLGGAGWGQSVDIGVPEGTSRLAVPGTRASPIVSSQQRSATTRLEAPPAGPMTLQRGLHRVAAGEAPVALCEVLAPTGTFHRPRGARSLSRFAPRDLSTRDGLPRVSRCWIVRTRQTPTRRSLTRAERVCDGQPSSPERSRLTRAGPSGGGRARARSSRRCRCARRREGGGRAPDMARRCGPSWCAIGVIPLCGPPPRGRALAGFARPTRRLRRVRRRGVVLGPGSGRGLGVALALGFFGEALLEFGAAPPVLPASLLVRQGEVRACLEV